MATVYIPKNTPSEKRAALDGLLDSKRYFDPNWSGADFKVEVHEHPTAFVDCPNAIDGASLLSEINDVLFGEVTP